MATITATTQHQPQTVTVVVTDQKQFMKRQNQAMVTPWLLFITAGMELALSLGWSVEFTSSLPFRYCWFIAFICGSIISSALIRMIPKLGYYIFGTLMVLIAGIIYTSAPYNYDAIIAARCLSGLGVGATTVPFIVNVGEINFGNGRASTAGMEHVGYSCGIAIQVIWCYLFSSELYFAPIRSHGIILIVLAIAAAGCLGKTIESPVFYILRNNEASALKTQATLTPPNTSTQVSQAAYDEVKMYVVESDRTTLAESALAFVKLLIYRCLVAFSFSLPLNLYLLISSFVSTEDEQSWPIIVYGVLRLCGSVLGMVLIELVGRKVSSLVSLAIMAGLLMALAVYTYSISEMMLWYSWKICRIIMAFSFFAGVFAPSSTAYLSEAFSVKIKPFFIALIVCIEQLIHIIVIATFTNPYAYFLSVSIIIIVALLVFVFVLPETRRLSLLEAQRRFKSSNHVRAY